MTRGNLGQTDEIKKTPKSDHLRKFLLSHCIQINPKQGRRFIAFWQEHKICDRLFVYSVSREEEKTNLSLYLSLFIIIGNTWIWNG